MRTLTLTLICGVLLASAQVAGAVELWFSPNDNLPRGANRNVILNEDYPHLFDDSPQWSARIDVFHFSPMMAGPNGPEEELSRINAFAERRHIKLAAGVDATLLDNPKPVAGECGPGIEGMMRPGQNLAIFRRLKRIGVALTYVAMDEPLTFGHYFQGRNACGFSIADTARRAAAAIAEIKTSYPDIRVVDDEAPPAIPIGQWRAEFAEFLKDYRAAAGAPLDAVMFDVNLFSDWRERVAAGVEIARREGSRAGILVFKPGPGLSDEQAVADYKRAIAAIDASRLRFDAVEIANWTPHPFNNLPQSDPTTLTYVLDVYNRAHGRK
jgi:hypothetical protein